MIVIVLIVIIIILIYSLGESMDNIMEIRELAEEALQYTEASHHKQWYLEEIYELAGGTNEISDEVEEGIAP